MMDACRCHLIIDCFPSISATPPIGDDVTVGACGSASSTSQPHCTATPGSMSRSKGSLLELLSGLHFEPPFSEMLQRLSVPRIPGSFINACFALALVRLEVVFVLDVVLDKNFPSSDELQDV